MKKISLGFVMIAMAAIMLPGQETIKGQLPQMPLSERMLMPEIQDTAPFTYAYLECKGSYAQISVKIGEFMQLFFGQNLVPVGSFFSMYLNSPDEVKEEDLQWRMGFPVAADTQVAAPLQKGDCTASKIAVYLYTGPYENVGYGYGKIAAFCDLNGYKVVGPRIEKYLDMNPQAVKPEERRTEINIPVEKK